MTEDEGSEPSAAQARANYRRRLHTVFDHLLGLVNNADPLIRQDALALAQQMEAELMTNEPDLMTLIHLHALRLSVDHHKEVIDSLALVLRGSGISWRALGDSLGISAQAAQKRYGNRKVLPRDFDLVERYLFRTDTAMEQSGVEPKWRES